MDFAITITVLTVLFNIGWLILLDRILKRQQHERWELYERIRSPENVITPPKIIEDLPEPGPIVEDKPIDEVDLVGTVDPPTPLREQ